MKKIIFAIALISGCAYASSSSSSSSSSGDESAQATEALSRAEKRAAVKARVQARQEQKAAERDARRQALLKSAKELEAKTRLRPAEIPAKRRSSGNLKVEFAPAIEQAKRDRRNSAPPPSPARMPEQVMY